MPGSLLRLLRSLLVLPLAAAGAAAGLLGSFVHPLTAGLLPFGLLLAGALSAADVVTAGLLAGRAGAVATGLGWVSAVLVLSGRRPEGDLVVPGTALGYGWLLGGTVLVIGAAALPYGRYRRFRAPAAAPKTPEWTRR